jgi:NAD(P)H-nitrite reductase large subunit
MKTRCECRNLSFAGLLAYARRNGIRTVDELSKATTCCTGCGSCRPYLEELLRSGKLRVGDELIDFPHNPDEPLNVPGEALGGGER